MFSYEVCEISKNIFLENTSERLLPKIRRHKRDWKLKSLQNLAPILYRVKFISSQVFLYEVETESNFHFLEPKASDTTIRARFQEFMPLTFNISIVYRTLSPCQITIVELLCSAAYIPFYLHVTVHYFRLLFTSHCNSTINFHLWGKKKCKIYLLFYFFFFFIISVLHQWTETIVDIIKGAQSKSAFINKSNSIFKNLAERIKAI